MIPAPSGARVWLAAGQRHQHDIVRPTILADELDWPRCLREQSRPLRLDLTGSVFRSEHSVVRRCPRIWPVLFCRGSFADLDFHRCSSFC
jgi:hypothetical protein